MAANDDHDGRDGAEGRENAVVAADEGEIEEEPQGQAEGGNVENFVTRHFEEQMSELDSTVSQERRSDFFTRALAESQRMNKEVTKSHKQMARLHMELSTEMFDSWRTEHSSEVLRPEEQRCVEGAARQTAQDMADS